MKRMIAKMVNFFTSKRMSKYVVTTIIYLVVLAAMILILWSVSSTEVIFMIAGTAIGFLGAHIFVFFFKFIVGVIEDVTKVSGDTKAMLDIYDGDPSYRKVIEFNGTSQEVAYADILINKGYKFEVIDDPHKEFQLDDYVSSNFAELIEAHTRSALENSITIRLDDFQKTGDNTYTFYLSRSTYFNHLVTNRAIDFQLSDGLTLRQVYDFGPYVCELSKSKMSNHIGINGLVFLNDGHLIVPRRRNDSTISKNSITSSIAVKFNFPKGVRPHDTLTKENLLNDTILDALDSRLHLSEEYIHSSKDIETYFLGFGSNIYEGGKPQLYFVTYLKDVNLEKYYSLISSKRHKTKLDQDKAIYPVRFSDIKFNKKGLLVLPCHIQKKNKYQNIILNYEKSFLCNIWHYNEFLKNK